MELYIKVHKNTYKVIFLVMMIFIIQCSILLLLLLSNKNLENLVDCKAVQVFQLHDTDPIFFAHGIYMFTVCLKQLPAYSCQ